MGLGALLLQHPQDLGPRPRRHLRPHKIKIIHYIRAKPWQDDPTNKRYEHLNKLWWDMRNLNTRPATPAPTPATSVAL